MRVIKDAIEEHKNAVLKEFAEDQLLGVFLYGSQNYGVSTLNSDVDTKAILIPTVRDLCLNKPVSRELHFDNGEHCEVKDIRELVKIFKKQNINFVEILYTDHYWINPKYERIWRQYFIENREQISHFSEKYTTLSICGQAIHTLKQNRTDGKKFGNGLRLYYFLTAYLEGKPYEYCLDMASRNEQLADNIIAYKEGRIPVSESEVDNLIMQFERLKNIVSYYEDGINTDIKLAILNLGTIALITNDQLDFDFYNKERII